MSLLSAGSISLDITFKDIVKPEKRGGEGYNGMNQTVSTSYTFADVLRSIQRAMAL